MVFPTKAGFKLFLALCEQGPGEFLELILSSSLSLVSGTFLSIMCGLRYSLLWLVIPQILETLAFHNFHSVLPYSLTPPDHARSPHPVPENCPKAVSCEPGELTTCFFLRQESWSCAFSQYLKHHSFIHFIWLSSLLMKEHKYILCYAI